MKVDHTSRGFQIIEFTDIYGIECSLQQSSLATPAVWLGPNEANPKCLIPGKSWQPVPFLRTPILRLGHTLIGNRSRV
jgi:hypothetical protein